MCPCSVLLLSLLLVLTGAGAGVREEFRAGPSTRQQQGAASTPTDQASYYAGRGGVPDFTGPMREEAEAAAKAAAAAAKAAARDNKASWSKQKEKKSRPEAAAAATSEPQRPAEVVQDTAALEVFRREQEAARRALNMQRQEQAAVILPIGRCCLNRGLHNKVEHCRQDEIQARVSRTRPAAVPLAVMFMQDTFVTLASGTWRIMLNILCFGAPPEAATPVEVQQPTVSCIG